MALADRDVPGVTEGLLARLDVRDPGVRRAVGALAAGTPGVTEGLLARLDDPDGMCGAAVRALADRRDPGGHRGAAGSDRRRDPRCRAAVEALAEREEPGVTEGCWAASASGPGLGGMRWWGRWRTGTTPGDKALLGRLSDPDRGRADFGSGGGAGRPWDPGVTTRCWAASATRTGTCGGRWRGAGGREDPGVTEALLARLTDQDGVRRAVVGALAGRRTRGHRSAPGMPRRPGRVPAGCGGRGALAWMPTMPRGDLEALLGCLTDPDDWYVRGAAVRALAGRHDPGVTKALLGCRSPTQDGCVRVCGRLWL